MSNEFNDKSLITEIMTRYAAGIDSLNFDLYSNCFAEDVELHGFGGNTEDGTSKVIRGKDSWIDYVKGAISKYSSTQHLLGNPLIEISGKSAKVRTDVQARHYLKEPEGTIFCLWAVYYTNMIYTQGRWKIIKHRLRTIGSTLDGPS